MDARIVETFQGNLDTLLQECRSRQVRVVLLPHTMTPALITEGNYKWWAPYLTKRGLFDALDAINAVMQSRADGDQVVYAGFVRAATWVPAEFYDPSHLNAKGNLRFAQMLKDGVPWSLTSP